MHANEMMLRDLYGRFARGDMEGVLALCHDDITFVVPGKTSFSGTHTKATFPVWIGKVMEVCGGDFREEAVDIIANDEHGIVVLDHFVGRAGKRISYRTDHIWGIRGGKCTSFLERPGDEEQFNRAWT
ncbi:MAG: nuclear transport factor 2 family protein [Chloroflexota bacterium]|nr:nuclear transport factor 2 family protein [Chloroflexota bacterium]